MTTLTGLADGLKSEINPLSAPLPEPVAVLYTCNRKYMAHLAAAVTSLLDHNAKLIKTVYVIHDDIDRDSETCLIDFIMERFQVPVVFIPVDTREMKQLKTGEHFTYAAYLRLLMDQVLPTSVDRVLYLDTDCMVVDSLVGLLAQDFIIPAKDGPGSLECHICAADHWYERKMQRLRKELNLDPDARYFNNGVLMVNLKLWRSQATGRQALKMAFESNGRFRAHDQDICNILFQHSWVRIHARYNMFGEMFCGKAGGCAPSELDEALERPAIIHFTGASKPWNYLNDHPYKKIYWHYRSMTPWKRRLPEDFSIKSMIWKHMPPMARSLVARCTGT